MGAAVIVLGLCLCVLGQAEEGVREADAQVHLSFLKEQAAALTLRRAENRDSSITMTPDPVLRYSNPLSGGQGGSGATYLWLEDTRPIAALSLSIRPADNRVYLECAALVAEPLVCLRHEAPFWSPTKMGLSRQILADAPPPADNASRRLAQMRKAARRFSAATYTQADVRTELRLLPTPLYRFAAEELGVIDGAQFAFVVSNDPELFLLLEAVRAPEGDRPAGWKYSLARMSSRREVVSLDDKQIWSTDNFYRAPIDQRTGEPYIELRLGPAINTESMR
jgi:hypothetical protein